ncbi:MAG: DUF1553 domain-containing protein [Pedosphaera sp.]|nr:DUF1553 domain-containing protein [Pedosphaera sp.]
MAARQLAAAEAPAAVRTVTPEAAEFFEKKIRPLFTDRCYECHSAEAKKIKGGLRLDLRDGALKGGDSGPAVVPGEPEKSRLIKAVRYTDTELVMPPKHKLSPEEVADLMAWVNMGAPDPRSETNAAAPGYGGDFAAGKKHWSLQPVRKSPLPAVKNPRWPRGDVDRFVLAKLEEKKLSPARDASKQTLIRRATFDLTGLPPTPGEVDAFLADKSSRAFEKVVDRLLASPAYGERWGRHWLDVVRYADTSGCNSDYPIPDAHKYRDWVINAFNRDLPYDQFIREQIAGDLLPAKSDAERYERIIATGYLAIARRFGSRNNEFHLTIEDTIDNVGKGVLGLSLSCARCHDHKFDPILNREYYALYGIFNSTRYAFPGTEIYKHPKDFVPLVSGTNVGVLAKYQADLAALDDEVESLKNKRIKLGKVGEGDDDSDVKDAETREKLAKVRADLKAVRERQKELEANPPNVPKAYAVADGKVADAKIQKKGQPGNLGDVVPRGFLQVLGGQILPADEKGSGRLELAQWLTDAKNPLAARVMVNRIWQHHFGRGIVQTPNDFGTRGKPPTHPELLDYLAAKFIESGWSVKAMQKVVMLSRAYQMSSGDNARSAETDVNNDWLWRFNRRRLAAEEVRDAMLAVGGNLDRTMVGAQPFPPENEWKYTQHTPFVAVYQTDRRSVYLMQQRIKKNPFLEMFDGADTNATTGERPLSTTPLQALFMMNDPFAHTEAERFAERVAKVSDEAKRIDSAYRIAFGRPATREEIALGGEYLKSCAAELKRTDVPAEKQSRAALASYCRVLLSSNEFLFVD